MNHFRNILIQLLWEIEKIVKTLVFFFFFFSFPIKIFLKSQIALLRPNNSTIAQTQSHTSLKHQFSAQAKYIHHFCADDFENYLKYHVPKTLSPHELLWNNQYFVF